MEIYVNNLRKIIQNKVIIDSLDLNIKSGEIYGIMGVSGCGKTTLLKILGGIEKYNSGCIKVNDKEYYLEAKDKYRNNIGSIYQDFNLLEGLTVKENILLPLVFEKKCQEEQEAIYTEIVEDEIKNIQDKFIHEISGGQQQKVAIYRALIKKPPIILADELTGNLDPFSTQEIFRLLIRLNKKMGITMVIVTHDFMAARYCDRIGILQQGKIQSEYSRNQMDYLEFMNFLMNKIEVSNEIFKD